jgi:hypothetical protein
MTASNALRLTETSSAATLPRAPRSPEETGLGFSFLVELAAKILFVRGQLGLHELVSAMKLLPTVINPLLDFMRTENMCEVARQGGRDGAFEFKLTDLGRARAQDFMRRSQYTGAAPVTIGDYTRQVQAQSVGEMGVTHERLQQAFSGVVVRDALLQQFGAAMNSGRAIFIYGPAGSGKTYLAERLVELLSGDVVLPHALAVQGEVIQVFDPLVHEPVTAPDAPAGLDRGPAADARWVLCRRPIVMTGAELTLSMVDLEFDEQTRHYQAPQQVKANNGLFILDDLGRQLVSAQDLMNRWIVPLDRRIDYLALHTGQKFMVPFDVIVVFSSNLRPSQLADEAFVRRLGYKIYVGPLEVDAYGTILRQVCLQYGVTWSDDGLDYLLQRHAAESRPLLACLPRDILAQVRDHAAFNGGRPQMSPELLGWAWDNYFAREWRSAAEMPATSHEPGDKT